MPGILCIESYWSSRLTDTSSVKGLLDVLAGARDVRQAHRIVHSREVLLDHLREWSGGRMRGFGASYLAFHGSTGTLYAGEDEVTLDDLATTLQGRCEGKRIHIAGCGTGAVDASELQELRRVSGAQWISAYTADVDWIEGAALDLLILDWLTTPDATPGDIRKGLSARVGDLAQGLGLVTVARSGVVALGPG